MPGKLRAPPEDEARTCGLTSSTVAYQKLPLNWTSREHPPEEGPSQDDTERTTTGAVSAPVGPTHCGRHGAVFAANLREPPASFVARYANDVGVFAP